MQYVCICLRRFLPADSFVVCCLHAVVVYCHQGAVSQTTSLLFLQFLVIFLKVFFHISPICFELHCHPFNFLNHFSTNQHSSYEQCHLLWATCCWFLWEDCKQTRVWQHLQIKTLPCLKLADSGCDGNVHGLVKWLWHWMNLSQPPELQIADWGEH